MSSLPYVNGGSPQSADQAVDILIEGEALSAITQGRILAYGCNWYPVNLLDPPSLTSEPPKRSLRRPGLLDWLQSQWNEAVAEPTLRAEVIMPMAIAAQVSRDTYLEKWQSKVEVTAALTLTICRAVRLQGLL